jgi:hypothetical protein
VRNNGVEHQGDGGTHLVRTLAVRFVHQVDVGDLHDAGLKRLNGIPGLWHHRQHYSISHFHNPQLGLPNAHSFHEDQVPACGIQEADNALNDAGQSS